MNSSKNAPPSSGKPHRANGTKPGRPKKVDDAEHITTAEKMKADGHTGKDIAKYLGVSRATLYRYLTEDAAAWPLRSLLAGALAMLTPRPAAGASLAFL